jgi:hypothetical protein
MIHLIFLLLITINIFANDTEVKKVSEAIGHMIGKNLKDLGLDFDLNAIAKGLQEETEGKPSPLNEEECIQAIAQLQDEKIIEIESETLHQLDTISNGDLIPDENGLPTR